MCHVEQNERDSSCRNSLNAASMVKVAVENAALQRPIMSLMFGQKAKNALDVPQAHSQPRRHKQRPEYAAARRRARRPIARPSAAPAVRDAANNSAA